MDIKPEAVSSIRDLVNLWPTRASLVEDIRRFSPGLKVNTPQVHKWAANGTIPARYHFPVLTAGRYRGFSIDAELMVRLHAPPQMDAA